MKRWLRRTAGAATAALALGCGAENARSHDGGTAGAGLGGNGGFGATPGSSAGFGANMAGNAGFGANAGGNAGAGFSAGGRAGAGSAGARTDAASGFGGATGGVGGMAVAGGTSGGTLGGRGGAGASASGGVTAKGTGGANASGGRAGGAGAASRAGASGTAGRAAGGSGGMLTPLTVFIAGDSTAMTYTDTASTTDQAGWGQMLGAHFAAAAKIDNRAIGGRTARRFIDEGHLDDIVADLHAGDYLLVQFGTNDSNKTATYDLDGHGIPYYLEPETDFKTYLQKYIDAAATHGATAALVTPTPRNSAYCTGGNGTGAWATAMRELGSSAGVAVLDLNQKTVDYLKAICPAPTPEDFFLVKSDGSVDGTHFQENGARILAGFVADEIERVALPLAGYLK